MTTVTVIVGMSVWIGASIAAGGREAWDHYLYWEVGYPVLALTAAMAGFLDQRTGKAPLVIAASQFVAMVLQNVLVTHNSLGLLPLGLVAFVVMSLPLFVPAYLGAAVARYLAPR